LGPISENKGHRDGSSADFRRVAVDGFGVTDIGRFVMRTLRQSADKSAYLAGRQRQAVLSVLRLVPPDRRAARGQALRTETTINNARDFYIGKSLHNLPALRKIGFQANRRVIQVQTITQDAILAEETLQQLQRPRMVEGQRVSALRLADPTVQALWNAVLMYDLLPAGFSNRQLRTYLAQLLGQPEEHLTQGRMSYHLRRLRLHGLIQRTPKTHRYRLTDFGLRTAVFCTRAYARIFRHGIGMVLPTTSPVPNPLLRCFDKLDHEIAAWVDQVKMAA
jgi:hypothetical protein